MVLVIDNYDSFTYNLVQYLGELGAEVSVRRNDQVTVGEIEAIGTANDVMDGHDRCASGEQGGAGGGVAAAAAAARRALRRGGHARAVGVAVAGDAAHALRGDGPDADARDRRRRARRALARAARRQTARYYSTRSLRR